MDYQKLCSIYLENVKPKVVEQASLISSSNYTAERTMGLTTMSFNRLNIPLGIHKTLGPTTCLEYLGIILDKEKLEARLPQDKVNRICEFIKIILHKYSCTKRELLQLLGHMNFATSVIIPGRSFVSYLIELSTSVKELHYYVHINKECRVDLQFWLRFLESWNGNNMFYDNFYTSNFNVELYTDASSTKGYGGYFPGKWFSSSWPNDIPSPKNKNLSMAFLELYPIVVAYLL